MSTEVTTKGCPDMSRDPSGAEKLAAMRPTRDAQTYRAAVQALTALTAAHRAGDRRRIAKAQEVYEKAKQAHWKTF